MRKLLYFLIALTLFGSFVQIIVIYFLPFVNMVNYGEEEVQLLGLAVLMIPVILFVLAYRLIVKVVKFFLNRGV